MADRTEQVHIRVTPERKEEWKNAAEERDQRLAAYVRWCVNQQIRSDTPTEVTSGVSDANVDALTEEIQSVKNLLDGGGGSVIHRLQAIEGEVRDDPESREIATEVYGVLPSKSQIENAELAEAGVTGPVPDEAQFESQGSVLTGLPEDIASFIEEPLGDVERALRELQQELHNVQEEHGRYYRL